MPCPKVATLKKLFLPLLIIICAIGWFSEPIMNKLGVVKVESIPESYSLPKSNFILPDQVPTDNKKPAPCVTLAEYVQQANSNPNAYYKLFNCDQSVEQRTELDKLINFLQYLKYE